MRLIDWVDKQAMERGIRRQAVIAEMPAALGISVGYARSLVYGRLKPSVKLAKAIEAMTGGEVSAVELVFGDHKPQAQEVRRDDDHAA